MPVFQRKGVAPAAGRVDWAKTIEGVTNDATTSRPVPTNRTDVACCSRRAGRVGLQNRRDLSHCCRNVGAFCQRRPAMFGILHGCYPIGAPISHVIVTEKVEDACLRPQ